MYETESQFISETETLNSNSSKRSKDDIIMDVRDINFTSKEILYYKSVNRYFRKADQESIKKMVAIIEGDSSISLRLLDWYVTKYASRNKISYDSDNSIDIDRFNVYINYKSQLKSYKKKYFDPFRRRKKFFYYYDKNDRTKRIHTTIGQLNFFKWAFLNNIIDEVEKNYSSVIKEMIKSNKEDKKKKEIKSEKSDSEKKEKVKTQKDGIIIEATKMIKNDNVKIVLKFD